MSEMGTQCLVDPSSGYNEFRRGLDAESKYRLHLMAHIVKAATSARRTTSPAFPAPMQRGILRERSLWLAQRRCQGQERSGFLVGKGGRHDVRVDKSGCKRWGNG